MKWEDHDLKKIRKFLLSGWTLSEVGSYFGITRQRVNQLISQYSLIEDGEIWGRYKKAAENKAKYREEYLDKYGFYPEDKRNESLKKLKIKFYNKKNNAKKRGYEFSISFYDLSFPEHCPILGIKLDYENTKGWNDCSPAIDRIDNSKGYVKGNVQVISTRAHRIKNDSSVEELEKILTFLKQQEKESK